MDFDIPRGVVLPVDLVDVRLDAGPHPFETVHGEAIEANWRVESRANPALFDGRMSLLSQLAYRDRQLVGRCHMVRYATFLHWRRTRPHAGAGHAFAHPMPVTSDGALIAARMGAHTANPGRIYFAAGSFDEQDFSGDKVDVEHNMAREVAEEIGVRLDGLPRDPTFHAWTGDAGTVIFRRYRLPMTAEQADRAIRSFIAAETNPEIEEPVVIRSADDLPDRLSPHMPVLIAWHFRQASSTP